MAMTNQGVYPNWAELPPELTSSILHRLGGIDILETAQRVCRSWRRVCKDPLMWRKIDMRDPGHRGYSCHVSSKLRSLKLTYCYQIASEGLREILAKLPLLEVLETSYCALSAESLKVIGKSCPNLKSFGKNCEGYRRPRNESDDVALAIAETMPGLTRLQLFGNRLTDVGLNAILDGCPNLEYLDLRQCFNVSLVGDLEKRCSERIRVVRRPNDSTHDYPFDATVHDMDSSEDDYLYEDEIAPDEFYENLSAASDDSDLDPFDYY
ncbi:hypothetical protein Bca4012_053537 [Brassica carinata]